MTTSSSTPQLLIGTAGHIDHGKSRLVQTLTGKDPDRLPEEKARGMTIELGFAHAGLPEADLWFVDVPGHERFLRTMVAGAAGIDLAMLVVAADDSVMPQTREHAEVLKLLGVQRCLVVLTKLDLVDDEWAEAVGEEVAELLEQVGLESIGCIATSAEDGRGIDALRAALVACATEQQRDRARPAWFRLPIDRSFSVPGRGTVVTGSLLHGGLAAGEDLELLPHGERVRGRELQTDHDVRGEVAGRMRLAVNLASIRVEQAARGCELATPGFLEPTQCLTVYLAQLRAPGKMLRKRQRMRLHLATSEVRCEAQFFEAPTAGETRDEYVQLRCDEPVVASWGQRFILRDDAGKRTLGGGAVVESRARPWSAKRPPNMERLDLLRTGKPRQRVRAALQLAAWEPPAPAALAARSGCRDAAEAEKLVRELSSSGHAIRLARTLATETVAEACEHALQRLTREAEQNPRWAGVPTQAWNAWMPAACPEALRGAVAEWLIESGQVAVAHGHVLPPGHAGAMSEEDQQLLATIVAELDAGGFQPRPRSELAALQGKTARRAAELLELALKRGEVIRIEDEIWLSRQRWDELVEHVRTLLQPGQGFTVSQLRQQIDSTRKYVVPIAEALDKHGITRRQGDVRVGGPALASRA